ncbi:iron ABC transporter ATP-binding protein [Moraxella marmotae]|uniref:iron ABC transporter ATP-binding protein n=1 Tax=Moraxella marmotae TaxID=3344520 RepID=UPI0035F38E80
MITFKNIQKQYNEKCIIQDFNLQLPKSKIISLIGPNGAGKSTLLMMLARLTKPTQGSIWIDGKDIAGLPIKEYAKQVATLRQANDINLRLRVSELVAFGRFPYNQGKPTEHDLSIVNETLQLLELAHLKDSYLDELSGGQRQMVFLAMVLSQQTDIILLDEPLNNLDMKYAVKMMQVLRMLVNQHNRTIILIVHDINFASHYSDYIVALKDGQLFAHGEPDSIITAEHLNRLYEINFDIIKTQTGMICNYFHG